MFRRTPVVTIRTSVAALRLKLWDEESGALVRIPRRRALAGLEVPTGREPLAS
jgi:hypothetical protein